MVNMLRWNGNSESGHVTFLYEYGRLHGWSEQGAQSSNRVCFSRTGADGRVESGYRKELAAWG